MKTKEDILNDCYNKVRATHPFSSAATIWKQAALMALDDFRLQFDDHDRAMYYEEKIVRLRKRLSKHEWIPIKDKRPEIGTIVIIALLHSKVDVYTGFRANGGWYCFRIGEDSKYYIPNGIEEAKITDWMPLPEF